MARPTQKEPAERRCRFVKEDGNQCRLPAATDKKANGYCYHHMGAQRRRTWGSIKRKSSGYQASYVGPDDQRHLGLTIFMAKVDAEVWLAKERRLIDLDEWTSPLAREDAAREAELRAKAAALTLREYADPWVQNRHNRNGQPLKARSQADYRRLLKAKIYPKFGDTELKDITKDDVLAWYRTLAKTPTEQASAYALLRTILTTAVEDERIAVNPCRIKGAGKAPVKHRVEMVTSEQLAQLHAEMPERYRLTVLLGVWCTLRIGEILELRRGDVTITHSKDKGETPVAVGVLHVRRSVQHIEGQAVIDTPKTAAGAREVHVPPALIPDLVTHLSLYTQPGRMGLLFPSGTGNPLHHRTFGNWWNKARIAAGRPNLRFHDLRHTGATMAAQSGATLKELMDRLGHTTPKAALVYQHTAADRDQLIAERLSARMTSEPRERS